MFSGIIEDLGIVESVGKGRNFRLAMRSWILKDQKAGSSISVNGVCLTIADLKNNIAGFDVMDETVKTTNLGGLKKGDKVNLERALRAGDSLGGHLVSGHIDCTGLVISKNKEAGNYFVEVKIPKEYIGLVARKGSVSLDGISLTVGRIDMNAASFVVYLVPHTLHNTNLASKNPGSSLNIEFDLIAKYVFRYMESKRTGPGITDNFLKKHGFSN